MGFGAGDSTELRIAPASGPRPSRPRRSPRRRAGPPARRPRARSAPCSSSTRSRSPAFMNSQLPGVPAPAPSATPTWATVRRVRRRRAGRVEHLKPAWFQGTAGGPVSGGPRLGSGRCVPPNRPRLMSQPGLEARRVVGLTGCPQFEVGGEGRVLAPAAVRTRRRAAGAPRSTAGRCSGEERGRGEAVGAAHRRAVRDGGAGRRAGGGDGGGPLEGELVRPAPTTSSSPRTRITVADAPSAPRESQVRPRRRLTESPGYWTQGQHRCRQSRRGTGSVWPESPRWARIRTQGRARPRRARRAVDDTAPEKNP